MEACVAGWWKLLRGPSTASRSSLGLGGGSRKWAKWEYLMTACTGWVATISILCLPLMERYMGPSPCVNQTHQSWKPKQHNLPAGRTPLHNRRGKREIPVCFLGLSTSVQLWFQLGPGHMGRKEKSEWRQSDFKSADLKEPQSRRCSVIP